MSQQRSLRFCPTCGAETPESLCPHDQSRTFVKPGTENRSHVFTPGEVVLGRYRIWRLIGKGGFAEVYAGEHTGTLQPVALKVMLPQALTDEVNVRRFFREAQITARLKHENTVRVIDVDQSEQGYPFLAMELLEGRTLEAWLRAEAEAGRVLDEVTTTRIGMEVLSSLEEAHANSLVHRDLKPANIMMIDSPDGTLRLKVLDFGAAHMTSTGVTTKSSSLGTPDYMSPEQCRSAEVDGRSDLYALGAILYRCVAGVPPFVSSDAMSVMYQHANQLPRNLRETAHTPVSPVFVAVVMKALAKSPQDRFQSSAEMRTALRDSAGLGTLVTSTPAASPTAIAGGATAGSRGRPSLVPVMLWSSLGLVLLGIGAVAILLGRDSTPHAVPAPPLAATNNPPIRPAPADPRSPGSLGIVAVADPYQMRTMIRWAGPVTGETIPAPQIQIEVLRGTQALPIAAARARTTTGKSPTEFAESNPAGDKRASLSLLTPGSTLRSLDVVAEVGNVGLFRATCNLRWEAGRGYMSDGDSCVLVIEPVASLKPVALPGAPVASHPGKRPPEKNAGNTAETTQPKTTASGRPADGKPILRPIDEGDPWSKPSPRTGTRSGDTSPQSKLDSSDPWRKGK